MNTDEQPFKGIFDHFAARYPTLGNLNEYDDSTKVLAWHIFRKVARSENGKAVRLRHMYNPTLTGPEDLVVNRWMGKGDIARRMAVQGLPDDGWHHMWSALNKAISDLLIGTLHVQGRQWPLESVPIKIARNWQWTGDRYLLSDYRPRQPYIVGSEVSYMLGETSTTSALLTSLGLRAPQVLLCIKKLEACSKWLEQGCPEVKPSMAFPLNSDAARAYLELTRPLLLQRMGEG